MQKFINNWSTKLTAPIGPNDTILSIDLESANRLSEGFQQGDYYLLTLDDGTRTEIVKVVSINQNQLKVFRNEENTNYYSWTVDTKLELRLTQQGINLLQTTIDKVLTADGHILVSPKGDLMTT